MKKAEADGSSRILEKDTGAISERKAREEQPIKSSRFYPTCDTRSETRGQAKQLERDVH